MAANKEVVQKSIAFHNTDYPFRFSQTGVLTGPGRAIFPYRHWYRGRYMSPLPIIADREAGFYPRIWPYPSFDFYNNTPFGSYYNYAFYPQHQFWGASKQPRFVENVLTPRANPRDGRLRWRDDPLFLYR